jgi:hypothetical protein
MLIRPASATLVRSATDGGGVDALVIGVPYDPQQVSQ